MRVFFNLSFLLLVTSIIVSCGGSGKKPGNTTGDEPKSMIPDTETYDPNRGTGKFTAENVTLGALDAAMVSAGEGISKKKWIMNFITNPDAMIDKDPAVQAQLELCLVRMPNQNLNDEDARKVVEFMRQNDSQ